MLRQAIRCMGVNPEPLLRQSPWEGTHPWDSESNLEEEMDMHNLMLHLNEIDAMDHIQIEDEDQLIRLALTPLSPFSLIMLAVHQQRGGLNATRLVYRLATNLPIDERQASVVVTEHN